MNPFNLRRNQVAKALGDTEALLLPSLPEFFRQPDVTYPYRQDSCFYYLTGFEEPESFLILKKSKSILFLREKNKVKELWEGERMGVSKAKDSFKMTEVYPLSYLDEKLEKELKGIKTLIYNKIHPDFDQKIKKLNKTILPARSFLGTFRKLKSDEEINSLKKACEVTSYAHQRLAQCLRPEITERALHGIFLQALMEKNALREGYQSIIACGNNGNTIHYIKNDDVCKEGDLLLVDAGAEVNYYTADVTRIYPVSGSFSEEQKYLYKKLLKLQKSLIQEVKPDVSFKTLEEKMQTGITEILLETQILKGTLREHVNKKSFKSYCPHSIGHLLGMDVHDPGFEKKDEAILKPSMIMTIEPGIYIPYADKEAPKGLRGLALRIEDNILITSEGYENLTQAIPKEVEEVESLCS